MKINKTSIPYLIHCLSPLHVGSGDSNYGIIDNLVQRDPITHHPIIHSSSLKGALREYFSSIQKELVEEVFGSESGTARNENNKPGLFDFHQGYLLSLPVRSSHQLFANVTTPRLIQQFKEQLEQFGYSGQENLGDLIAAVQELHNTFKATKQITATDPGMEGAVLEEFDFVVKKSEYASKLIRTIFGDNLVIMPDNHFKDIIEALPVIARNSLENGQSVNLFYEEVVPRESRFFTIITTADRKVKSKSGDEKESESITNHVKNSFELVMGKKELIQLGANASVGYGKTLFTNLSNLG